MTDTEPRRAANGDEVDAHSRFRHFLHWRPGERKAVKRRTNRPRTSRTSPRHRTTHRGGDGVTIPSAIYRAGPIGEAAAVGMGLRPEEDWALHLFVPGRPAPQGSKRHVGNGVMLESSKALGPWRTVVSWHAAQAYKGAPLDGPIRVVLDFIMPRPAATPKKNTPAAIKKPDVDKLSRAILDSLTSVVWRDDSQVVDMHSRKRLARLEEQPGCLIRIARGA